jgi:group I intron endonuclease
VYLQRSWNKYGEQSFKFEILKEFTFISEEHLLDEELKSVNELLPEYNVGSVGGGDNLTNNPNREDIIKRITLTLREQVKNMTDEQRKQRWGRSGKKNSNWKGGISSNTTCVDCHKPIDYGHKRCISCSKNGKNNSFYGKQHTTQSKEKIRQKMKGRLPINTNPITINGISYKSQAEASRKLGVSIGTISNWVRGKFKPRHQTLSMDDNHNPIS